MPDTCNNMVNIKRTIIRRPTFYMSTVHVNRLWFVDDFKTTVPLFHEFVKYWPLELATEVCVKVVLRWDELTSLLENEFNLISSFGLMLLPVTEV